MTAESETNRLWRRRTEKVSEVIAREIVHDIVNRNLKPGTRLPSEVEMLETYDVGRASLREALRILEVYGLIAIKPGRGGGPVVSDVGGPEFARMSSLYFHVERATYRDLVDARLIIEPMMANVLATRADSSVRAAMEAALELTRDAVSEEDGVQYIAAATEFHTVIMSLSGNPILDLYGESLRSIFAHRVSSSLYPPEHRKLIADHHQRIAEAIFARNAGLAEELMRSHMMDYASRLAERLPGLLDEPVDWR